MSIDLLNLGSAPDDGTGQDLRSGGQVINDNFAELDTRTAAAQAAANAAERTLVAGDNILIDRTDPDHPVISASGGGAGTVQTVAGVTPDGGGDIPTAGLSSALGLDNKVDKVPGKGLSSTDFTSVEKTKLAGVSTDATKNATDAALRDRATHTGTQLAATISDLAAAVRAITLAGLSLENAAITSADSVLVAMGRAQGQINDRLKIGQYGYGGSLPRQPAGFSFNSPPAVSCQYLADQTAVDGPYTGDWFVVQLWLTAEYIVQQASDLANGRILTRSKNTAWTPWIPAGGIMQGATASAAGYPGAVPKPAAGDQAKFLRADGTWQVAEFSKNYSSANTAFTNGGLVVFAHGLGEMPKVSSVHFTPFPTDQTGWTAGINVAASSFTLGMDAVNIYVQIASGGLNIYSAGTGTLISVAPGSWRCVARASA